MWKADLKCNGKTDVKRNAWRCSFLLITFIFPKKSDAKEVYQCNGVMLGLSLVTWVGRINPNTHMLAESWPERFWEIYQESTSPCLQISLRRERRRWGGSPTWQCVARTAFQRHGLKGAKPNVLGSWPAMGRAMWEIHQHLSPRLESLKWPATVPSNRGRTMRFGSLFHCITA